MLDDARRATARAATAEEGARAADARARPLVHHVGAAHLRSRECSIVSAQARAPCPEGTMYSVEVSKVFLIHMKLVLQKFDMARIT